MPRVGPAVVQFGPYEIIILGGFDGNKTLRDILLFDTKSECIESVQIVGSLKFRQFGNQCAMIRENTVAALVRDNDDGPAVIQFRKGSERVEILQGLPRW